MLTRWRPGDAWSARALFALMAFFVAFAFATGVRDVILPRATGGELFGTLQAAAFRYGPGYLYLELFAHNLGIACFVPALGLVLAHFERGRWPRWFIATTLLTGVVASLTLASLYVTRGEGFHLPFSLTLFVAEAGAVIGLAVAGHRAIHRLPPDEGLRGNLVPPMRDLAPWFLASTILLAVASFAETAWILGVHG